MPLPSPGPYRLTTTNPAGGVWLVTVTPTGMDHGTDHFGYDPAGDVFFREPQMYVECLGNGHFRATWGTLKILGDCEAL